MIFISIYNYHHTNDYYKRSIHQQQKLLISLRNKERISIDQHATNATE